MSLVISVKGKVKQMVSVQIEDLLPSIIEAIKEELELPEEFELNYTSKTSFLSFDVIKNKKQKDKSQCED